jgi:hypothetical protein
MASTTITRLGDEGHLRPQLRREPHLLHDDDERGNTLEHPSLESNDATTRALNQCHILTRYPVSLLETGNRDDRMGITPSV